MRQSVFFDGPLSAQCYLRFWPLPLLATVLDDRDNVGRCLVPVVAGRRRPSRSRWSRRPPLAVAGLALESGSVIQALGAVLLFLTNVVAIIGTGIVVMSIYGLYSLRNQVARGVGSHASVGRPVVILAVMLVFIGVPLTLTCIDVASRAVQESKAQRVADEWAQSVGWEVTGIATRGGELLIRRRGAVAAAGHNGTLCGTSRGRD